MVRTLYYNKKGNLRTDLTIEELPAALQDLEGLLWVDFEANPAEEDEPVLRETFGFHPLAIDDALQESHVPKLDDWGSYLYIVMHAVAYGDNDDDVNTLELDVFLGHNYLVTHHDQALEPLNRVWTSIQRDTRHLRMGIDHLLYRIADEVTASYMPVIDRFDTNIDQIEDEIFDKPSSDTLARVFAVKRSVLYLRRIIAPQREVLNKLARDDYEVIDEHDRIYFRDVYDHLVRMYDISEGLRDLVSGMLDTYLSVINNRMNDIMRTLTLITTVFMPISFIASFFGMNFFQPVTPLGLWTGMPAFAATLLIIGLTPPVMFWWMRRRGWVS
jgi:magnesium transporter